MSDMIIDLAKHTKLPIAMKDRGDLVERIRKSIQTFSGMDAELGGLTFKQFVRMLTVDPWRKYVPESARKGLHFLVSKREKSQMASEPAAKPQTSAEVLQVQALFSEVDADNSGYIDETELLTALRRLVKNEPEVAKKEPRLQPDALHKTVKDAMTKFGSDELIALDQFVKMIATKPFVALIGQDLADELKLKSAEIRTVISPRRTRPEPSQAQAYFREVKVLSS